MLDIGPMEVILIFVVALIIFGPGKLPELGRQIGSAVREFKRMSSAATEEMNRALDLNGTVTQNGHQNGTVSATEVTATVLPSIEPQQSVPYQSPEDTSPTDAPTSAAVKPEETSPGQSAPTPESAHGMVFCPTCKVGWPPTNNFCGACGTSLSTLSPETAEHNPTSPEQP